MNNIDFFKGDALRAYRMRIDILKERGIQASETIEDYTRWILADVDTALKFPKKNIYVQYSDGRFCILKDFYPDSNNSVARIRRVILQFPRCTTNTAADANDIKVAELPMDIYFLVKEKVLEDMNRNANGEPAKM